MWCLPSLRRRLLQLFSSFFAAAGMLLPFLSLAQTDELFGRFHNYTVEEGLSSSRTVCVAEDSFGFVWIGTEEGLNRFDGNKFVTYHSSQNQNDLPDDYIVELIPLEQGDLLGITYQGGVFRYRASSNDFLRYDRPVRNGVQVSRPYDICRESDNTFLIAYQRGVKRRGGLYRLDLLTGEQTLITDRIESLLSVGLDENGTIWAAGDTLWSVLPSGQVKHFPVPPLNNITRWEHEAMLVENQHIYLGAWGGGLVEFSTVTETFGQRRLFDEAIQPNTNAVRRIKRKNDQELWVITADRGLGVYHEGKKTFSFYKNDPTDKYSIFYISARDVMTDSRGILWAAMASGLSVFNPEVMQIRYQPIDMFDVQRVRLTKFNQAAILGDEVVLAASAGGGYWLLEGTSLRAIERVATSADQLPAGLSGVEVIALNEKVFTMSHDRLYEVSNAGPARLCLDLEERFGIKGAAGNINTLVASTNGTVLFGTDDNIVGSYNPTSDEVTLVPLNGNSVYAVQDNLVFEVVEQDSQHTWVATTQGVYRLTHMSTIERLDSLSAAVKSLGAFTMVSIDCNGAYLALGTTDSGIILVNLNTFEAHHIGREQGLLSLYIGELACDKQGHFWAVTGHGLVRIDPQQPNAVAVYTRADGLKYDDIANNEISALPDGRMVLGLGEGVAFFDPQSLVQTSPPARMYVDAVYRKGKQVEIGPNNTIEVGMGESIELVFGTLGYAKPGMYRYKWRHAGDTAWINMQEPQLVFSEMGRASTTIEVMASTVLGREMAAPLSISLQVLVPWYMSYTFWGILALALVAAVWIITKMRIQRVRRNAAIQNEYAQRLAEVEMSALRAQMNPHFLFNCLNSIKFFIINNEPDQASEYLTRFGRLIRLILSNSKSEVISLASELEALQLYVSLEALRFDDKFEFALEVDPNVQADFIDIPPMIVQPFAENAIWHGLHHKDGRGKLKVWVGKEEQFLICSIEDNGVGRAKAAELKSKSATRDKSFGLDITRRRLEILEGKLKKEGNIEITDLYHADGSPAGTRVTIRIPLD
ncbi:MAG: hypothetical protein RL226_1900 [Bacteroidota bacterium]